MKQPFNLKKGGGGGGGGGMFKQLDTFLFLFNCNQTKFFFLPSQNIFFFNALYKGVSQYSFLDAMHIAHTFPCYISHLYM